MARIESTGRYLPNKIVPNDFFSEGSGLFESIEDYFDGFHERRHAMPNETGLTMATAAAKSALSKSQYNPEDIDGIIGLICPNEHLYGEDLNLLQSNIGALNASVLPINTTCSTFLSALNIADSHINQGKKKVILIVVAVNWTGSILNTQSANFAFAGDGAAAVIVDNKANSLIDVFELNNSTPGVFQSMVMKNPVVTGKKEFFTISEPEGISLAKDMVLFPISVGKSLLERNTEVKVDKAILHQSGLKMMHLWLDKLEIPRATLRHTIEHFANMTTANIPVSLDYWIEANEISRGETIFFFAPAAGGHYIAMLWRY